MFTKALGFAFRQLVHHRAKLTVSLGGTSAAIVLMFMQLGFENALYDSALSIPNALDADIILVSKNFQSLTVTPPWISRSVIFEARGISGVESSVPIYVAVLSLQDQTSGKVSSTWLLGVPAHERALLLKDVNDQLSTIEIEDTTIIDQKSRNEFKAIVQQVKEKGMARLILPTAQSLMHYVSNVRGVFSLGPTFTVDGNLITSDLNFFRATSQPLDRVSLGLVRLGRARSIEDVKMDLQHYFDKRAKVMTKKEFLNNERHFYKTKTPIGYVFRIGLMVGIVVGIVFILQALHGIISDNLKEYAVMRTMGYENNYFLAIIGSIALAFSIAAYLPSICITFFLYHIASNATQLPLSMSGWDLIAIFAVVMFMGIFSTAIAVRKLHLANPVDLFS